MKYDVKNFSIEEKIKLLSGKNNWETNDLDGKLPSVFVADGPHGLRKTNDAQNDTLPATAMPSLAVLSSSWDRELCYLNAKTIADDCIEAGVDVLLAPGVNIKRTPLCGRNFEYFSEDPYLTSELASCYVDGLQDNGVGTCVKHYCLNNKEYERIYQSSEIEERALREIYLKSFERIIKKSQPLTMMCSYNKVNGVPMAENKWLLKDVLRDEFKFSGLIMSDWCAVKNPYKSAKATLDLEMPARSFSYTILQEAYDKGLITEEEIDFCVQNLFNLIEKLENMKEKRKVSYSIKERHENAVKIASESIVLLKNDGVLPIKNGRILISGNKLNEPAIGGGGSSKVKPRNKVISLQEELEKQGCNAKFSTVSAGISETWSKQIYTIYDKAYESDSVILLITSKMGEDQDRQGIKLAPMIEDFINQVAKNNKKVTVCLFTGSAVDMSAWIDNVSAVIWCGFAGEGVFSALAQILSGKISPSGKLSESYPLSIEDTPNGLDLGSAYVDNYSEGLMVGYRYYDKYNKNVLFPFGYGLSYANFEYSDLNIEKKTETDYIVKFKIKNTSNIDAKEISQVYIKDVFSSVVRPEKELKGFSKNLIKAGEIKEVSILLDKTSFSYYSVPLKSDYVENGWFEILVGSSSRDIKLVGKIKINLPETEQTSTEYVKTVDEIFDDYWGNVVFSMPAD